MSPSQQPETIRGEVTGSLSAAVGRAVRLAKQQKPTKNHYEAIVVLVEKRLQAMRAQVTDRTRDAA